jgi:hypothetical protein
MADIPSLINKVLSVGKCQVYIDSVKVENIVTMNLPTMQFPEVENESSTSSSPFMFYDPSVPSGADNEGSLIFDMTSPQLMGLVDPRKLRNVKIIFTVNSLNYAAGQVLPLQNSIEMTCQFGKLEQGELKQSQKQEQTLTFKMLSLTQKYNYVEVFHVDYPNSQLRINNEDAVAALAALFA